MKWGFGEASIWSEVKGQVILGEDDFVDSLMSHLKKHNDVPEIPKGQRYAHRPALEIMFKKSILQDKR